MIQVLPSGERKKYKKVSALTNHMESVCLPGATSFGSVVESNKKVPWVFVFQCLTCKY